MNWVINWACGWSAFSKGISTFHDSGLAKPDVEDRLNSVMSHRLRMKRSLPSSSTARPRVPVSSSRLVPGDSPVLATNTPVAPEAYSR